MMNLLKYVITLEKWSIDGVEYFYINILSGLFIYERMTSVKEVK